VSPQVPFLVSTGNYQFASPTHTPGTQTAQIDLYMQARASYAGIVLPAMGSMECDSVLTDNCYSCSGTSCSALGGSCAAGVCVTPNYTAFADALLTPVGQTQPYYTIDVNGTNNAWTSKFVFVACNAWSPAQATWLGQQLSVSTTYTFVIRNEGTDATTAPCLTTAPTADTIMAQYPYTLLIAGHTGTYAYYSSDKEVIVGNGGAPLSGAVDYGYVIAQQQASGSIVFTEYDYSTNLAGGTFTVQ
jgi:hypothetical protein